MSAARSVARDLVRLSLTGPAPEALTFYRLHGLLYFAQAWSLVLRDSELFPDDLRAADTGPVVPDVLAYQGDAAVWHAVPVEAFEREPDLDDKDEPDFLGRLWLSYGYLSTLGMHAEIQQDAPYLEAKSEWMAGGAGVIDVGALRESFARRSGIPTQLAEYQRARRQREKDAELAVLASPPLDREAIWGNCRSVTPSARRG
jgi:uncharacterized phage-associated protein